MRNVLILKVVTLIKREFNIFTVTVFVNYCQAIDRSLYLLNYRNHIFILMIGITVVKKKKNEKIDLSKQR